MLGNVERFARNTAEVSDVFLELPRHLLHSLERELAMICGHMVWNGAVYAIVQDDRPPVYLMFSEFTATFGNTLVRR
jgi:hypothetical protein